MRHASGRAHITILVNRVLGWAASKVKCNTYLI